MSAPRSDPALVALRHRIAAIEGDHGPPQAALPVLPIFNVNLYVRRGVVAPVIEELALHIRRWLPLLPAAA